jgi:hypothetical protein
MAQLITSLVGVTFEGRQDRLQFLSPGQKLFWKHEADNPHDPNAMKIFSDAEMTQDIGHLRANLAKKLVERIKEKNCDYLMFVEKVIGGGEGRNFGVRVLVVTQWPKRDL